MDAKVVSKESSIKIFKSQVETEKFEEQSSKIDLIKRSKRNFDSQESEIDIQLKKEQQ